MQTIKKIGLGLALSSFITGINLMGYSLYRHENNPYKEDYYFMMASNGATTAKNLERLDELFPYQPPKLKSALERVKNLEVLEELKEESIKMMGSEENKEILSKYEDYERNDWYFLLTSASLVIGGLVGGAILRNQKPPESDPDSEYAFVD